MRVLTILQAFGVGGLTVLSFIAVMQEPPKKSEVAAKTKDCSCKPCTCMPCRCALPKDMVKIDCPSCGGIGYYGKFFPCERCDGKGHVWVDAQTAQEKKAKDAAKCCCKDCKCCCCCKGAKK
jgi:hypothetical protein